MVPSTIHTLKGKKYRWVNVTHPGETELQYLQKTFGFHALDLKDCLPPLQRPKVIPRESYLFGLFIFPVFNHQTREVEAHEIDFFIGRDYVVTVHDNSFIELKNFFDLLEMNPDLFADAIKRPVRFATQLLDELFDQCFPMLFHISSDIDMFRAKVLHGFSKETVHEILRLKNNIVSFRKTMQPHRDMLKRMLPVLSHYLAFDDKDAHCFGRLVDHTKEIWDHLETYHSAIDAVEDTHRTMISFRLNEIMKTLTIFSIVILSLQLITNLFIIPAVSTPIIGTGGDFWALLGILTLGTLAAIGIFKKKGWL